MTRRAASGYNPKSQLVTQALHKRDILQTSISFFGILIIKIVDYLYALITMIELMGPVAVQQGALYVTYRQEKRKGSGLLSGAG